MVCQYWKCEAAFAPDQLRSWVKRKCNDCVERRRCRGECQQLLTDKAFTKGEWREAGKPGRVDHGKCRKCSGRVVGEWTCTVCTKRKPQSDFAAWSLAHPEHTRTFRAECDTCAANPTPGQPMGMWSCKSCGERNAFTEYSDWNRGNAARTQDPTTLCNACLVTAPVKASRGLWNCCQCKVRQAKSEFTLWLAPRKYKTSHSTARCNSCTQQPQHSAGGGPL